MRAMTPFERLYLLAEPFFPPLYGMVRRELKKSIAGMPPGHRWTLDVGGRKSHYTVGVPANLVVADLPRADEVQRRLNLGLNAPAARQVLSRRSNIHAFIYNDMTQSSWRTASFGCVVAVEVLEHVEQDECFVREVARVLKPGGVFLLTTPNGDFVANTNPDHKRHYRRAQLEDLLGRHFPEVSVSPRIAGGRFRRWGLQSWSLRAPLRTLLSGAGNVLNRIESDVLPCPESRTRHLFAVARKRA
jgi:SAM-dependent methyltransferase